MKPTENTFFFPFNNMRNQPPPPIEKPKYLEYLMSFHIFEIFDRGVSVGETGRGRVSTRHPPALGTDHLVNLSVQVSLKEGGGQEVPVYVAVDRSPITARINRKLPRGG